MLSTRDGGLVGGQKALVSVSIGSCKLKAVGISISIPTTVYCALPM